jgi:hypothetical protein
MLKESQKQASTETDGSMLKRIQTGVDGDDADAERMQTGVLHEDDGNAERIQTSVLMEMMVMLKGYKQALMEMVMLKECKQAF